METSDRSPALLRVAAAVLFPLSTAFPIAAGLLNDPNPPRWLGVADVAVAFGLAGVGLTIAMRQPGPFTNRVVQAAFQVLRTSATLFLALLVVFFLAGDALRWQVLLPGLAWRAWLFVLVLPSWLALAPGDGSPRR